MLTCHSIMHAHLKPAWCVCGNYTNCDNLNKLIRNNWKSCTNKCFLKRGKINRVMKLVNKKYSAELIL